MQSVPIITKEVSLNPTDGKVYSQQYFSYIVAVIFPEKTTNLL
jgi:hypothetical protein